MLLRSYPTGHGVVEIQAIGFADLANTRTISAGTLTLGYWNELSGPSLLALAGDVGTVETTLNLTTAFSAQAGDLIQIESEILIVEQAVSDQTSCQVARGAFGTAVAGHTGQTAVYLLDRKTLIIPFAPDFFGSPASGSYAYPVSIPDVRVATAELFVTNSRGNSDVGRFAYTATTDLGIRTLSGGQLSIQIEGPLAIQTNAAPLLLVEAAQSVRDVYAVVKEAPSGAPIQLLVTQNGSPYCQLTIADGATVSDTVDGFALGPLAAKAQVGLDITSVAQTSDATPGRDLTVTIRL